MIPRKGSRRLPSFFITISAALLAFLFLHTGPVTAKTFIKIAILSDPKNLNPFAAGDAWTKKITGLIYQPLYDINNKTLKLIPWLAEEKPLFDPDNRTVTIRLRKMNWDDGTPFTAEDVVFTAKIYRRFKVPRYYPYWKFVQKATALDQRTVKLTLERSMAVFITQTMTSLIVQKRKWEPIIGRADTLLGSVKPGKAGNTGGVDPDTPTEKQALNHIRNYQVSKPVGLGPFRYKERKPGAYILLEKNDHFFGQGKTLGGMTLGPHVDRVIFKVFANLGAATIALKNGDIDYLGKSVSQSLVEDLSSDPAIEVPMVFDHGYRYLAFNLRKPPMSDPAFRQAVAHLIDKDFIVERVLHNHGKRLDSIIPPANTFFFNPDTAVYGKSMSRNDRMRRAYQILSEAGYQWRRPPLYQNGRIEGAEGLLSKEGKSIPSLTFLTPPPQYDSEMAATGLLIRDWLQAFGIEIQWKPMAFSGILRNIRKERTFDLYILGWRNLSIDPDYLRRFFHSAFDQPQKRNYTGYRNAEFDRLADIQARTIDLKKRREIILELQSLLMSDLPYIPLFVPHLMEGIRTDRFSGWMTIGDGRVNFPLTFCLLKPTRYWEGKHYLHD